jgi:hypothetical protein
MIAPRLMPPAVGGELFNGLDDLKFDSGGIPKSN